MASTLANKNDGALGQKPHMEAEPSSKATPFISSQKLLQGTQSIIIDHEGALYTLRITRTGKLILTK